MKLIEQMIPMLNDKETQRIRYPIHTSEFQRSRDGGVKIYLNGTEDDVKTKVAVLLSIVGHDNVSNMVSKKRFALIYFKNDDDALEKILKELNK